MTTLSGASKAAERIWSLVSRLPSAKRRRRVLLMLQAYIDDSAKGDPNLFVLAGYISTTKRWAAFSDEWQRLLDHESNYYRKLEYFKMSEMTSENDKERCLWFHNVIEDHVMAAVSLTFPTKELQEEVSRIFHDDRKLIHYQCFVFWSFSCSKTTRERRKWD